jgi:hypothetical protein
VANRNLWQARLAKALKDKPLTLEDVVRLDSYVLALAFMNVIRAQDGEEQRKAILCYSTQSGKVTKQLEATELESRVKALEQTAAERNGKYA